MTLMAVLFWRVSCIEILLSTLDGSYMNRPLGALVSRDEIEVMTSVTSNQEIHNIKMRSAGDAWG